jgi:hypothetical protein
VRVHPRPGRLAHAVAAALVVPTLVAAGLSTVPTASATPTHPPVGSTATPAAARAALAEARALFSGPTARRGTGTSTSTGDATLVLRDLWRLRSQLQGADRAAADDLLTRPDYTETSCTPANCYHWQTTGPDAVDPTDVDDNLLPDYVDTVIAVVDGVRATYVDAGYRTPEPDGTAGGDSRTDIYLADVGSRMRYGYCTSDMEIPDPPPAGDTWAYCVLDNDYRADQFPTNTPLENLQVTAAHEYFHAVQFAYDAFEDAWFMEATATWAEDELYDDVDGNLQYLADSPLTRPLQPLDSLGAGAGPQYGAWIFFRFLTERLPESEGGLPTLVRDMWRRADDAPGGPDDYSIRAVRRVLEARGVTWASMFARFADANRRPRAAYDEGAADAYPSVGPGGTSTLSRARRGSGWRGAQLAHLSSWTRRFVPGDGLRSTAWRLEVSLDLPAAATSPAAVVTVYRRSGGPRVSVVPLNADGDATRKVAFGSRSVRYVEVTLANASTRFTCWTYGDFSCQGDPRDDRRTQRVRARATR